MPFEHPFAASAAVHRPQLTVMRDVTGGVRVSLAEASFVLSPHDAVGFATALLNAAGVHVEFENPMAGVIRPDAMRGH